MTWLVLALRQEVITLERSVVVHELVLAIKQAPLIFMKLRLPMHRKNFVFVDYIYRQ